MFQRHLKAYHVTTCHVTTSDSRNHNMAVCIAVIAKEVMIYHFLSKLVIYLYLVIFVFISFA